jgi:hypothetical protein
MTNTVTDQALKFHSWWLERHFHNVKGFPPPPLHTSMAEDFIVRVDARVDARVDVRVDARALLDSSPCTCKCILILLCPFYKSKLHS